MSTNIKNPDGSLTKIAGKTLQYPVNTNIGTSEVLQDAPVGHIISYMGTIAPAHYLVCDGSTYNISDYPKLANHFLTNFGSKNYFGGDGTATFAVPDLRGEFLRGTGTNSRVNQGSGATVGIHQDATNHIYYGHYHSNDNTSGNIWVQTDYSNSSDGTNLIPENQDYKIIKSDHINGQYFNMGGAITGSGEVFYTSRPTNTSVLYCIKAEPTYYMEIEDPGYSTDEVFTGKAWIDDKPIYRKVLPITQNIKLTKGSWYDVFTDSTNVDKILYNQLSNSATNVAFNFNFWIRKDASVWKLYNPSDVPIDIGASADTYIIVEYTKTTD